MVIGRFRNKDEVYKTLELHCADGLTYWVTGYPESKLDKMTQQFKWGTTPGAWDIPVEDHGKLWFIFASIVFFRATDVPLDKGERVFVYDEEADDDQEEGEAQSSGQSE